MSKPKLGVMSKPNHEALMREAIQLSLDNVASGKGGPFGAVIARDGDIVATGTNLVTKNLDPTAHAEVVAIRAATTRLEEFQLKGCSIYCSCEPCPMCLGAIYWARLDAIYYANSQDDAAEIGFDDRFIYQEIGKPVAERDLVTKRLLPGEAIVAFQNWAASEDKEEY